jgi:hypothetical protein
VDHVLVCPLYLRSTVNLYICCIASLSSLYVRTTNIYWRNSSLFSTTHPTFLHSCPFRRSAEHILFRAISTNLYLTTSSILPDPLFQKKRRKKMVINRVLDLICRVLLVLVLWTFCQNNSIFIETFILILVYTYEQQIFIDEIQVYSRQHIQLSSTRAHSGGQPNIFCFALFHWSERFSQLVFL